MCECAFVSLRLKHNDFTCRCLGNKGILLIFHSLLAFLSADFHCATMHICVEKILHTVLGCDIGLVVGNKIDIFKSAYPKTQQIFGKNSESK